MVKPKPIDLDAMSREELLVVSASQGIKELYPGCRLEGLTAAWRTLRAMANTRLEIMDVPRRKMRQEYYEMLYRRLPKWARWRRAFNILAAVQDGKQLRIRPSRRPLPVLKLSTRKRVK